MNNEKTLEKLHGIAQMLPKEEKKDFDYYSTLTPATLDEAKKYADNIALRLASMIADVEKEIKSESAKKSGKLDRLKAMQRIIKSAPAHLPALHGAFDVNGQQCVCDGYRLAALKNPLDLEKIPDNVQPIDAERIIKTARENNGETLDLPDVPTLKAYIKTEKALKKATRDKRPPVWDFGEALPLVNAQYLLDMLEIFPGATATASKTRPLTSAIYFKAADGEGVLLPVRKEDPKK